jgi:hydrogenase maturation protein HypF
MAAASGSEIVTAVEQAARLQVRGVVQGVGFRPFVYRLARECALKGWVRNTSWGVEIEVVGDEALLARFESALARQAPPLARIEAVASERIAATRAYSRFEILDSQAQVGAYQLISPDIATCSDCLGEVMDARDRRYRYPFTNCTNCGPRFTIIESIPYDRPRTTMRSFVMCPECQREYDDPLDRRFHAQPNACPVCGPHLTLLDAEGRVLAEADEALREAEAWLCEGRIVALKGLGGFQLACDATNAEAVVRLRARKRRPHKPFALMMPDLEAAERYARISDRERELLTSPAAPIVLLERCAGAELPAVVAPYSDILGLMLPYTPLHYLLMADLGIPLVMTSGNLSEEPIACDNDEALRRLGGIADVFLVHNRDIHARYDDSVWFVAHGAAQPVRRARGYAPFPIRLPFRTRPTLACGSELKNTVCLARDEYAFLSQHIGDMENLETETFWQEAFAHYRRLFDIAPEVIATDMHPDYATTRLGHGLHGEHVAVQHHHAHLAACLADNGVLEPAIGVILDGTGYGLDGRIWGGEFLVGDGGGFQRVAHLQYLPLPGGDAAIQRPERLAWAYLRALLPGRETEIDLGLLQIEQDTLDKMIASGLSTPMTSSAGRLFDAVSALLGICRRTSYEAQAAMELEAAARHSALDEPPYPFVLAPAGAAQAWGRAPVDVGESFELRLASLLEGILADLRHGRAIGEIAWRFHRTVAAMVVTTCLRIAEATGLANVALSGGCFQNRLLLELTVPRLRATGFAVLTHRQAPCNDGGVALGQAVVAHHIFGGR